MPWLFKRKEKLSRKDQSLARLENFRKEIVTDCHIIPIEELCERFDTDPVTGLTAEQAKEILKRTGPNALTPSKRKSPFVKFIETLFHGFSILLWIGAGLCFLCVLIDYATDTTKPIKSDNLILGAVLITVVVITGSFMFYEERKSQGIMDSFANMVPAKANVIRSGVVTTIFSRDLVVGDLVDVKFGDRVPADIRLISCSGLKVDNSPLTGESEPQVRSSSTVDENYLETKNVAFFSTNVVEGTGRGIAIGCGDHTVMGHIAGLTARLKPNETPMAKELKHFMLIISVWAVCLGLVFGIASLCMGHGIINTLLFVIGIIVSNVPEGLLATVIVCLTVTAKKMAAKNCLIKNLESVETLGSTSIICSDKTGTLTQNRMTVSHVWYNGKIVAPDLTPGGQESSNDQSYREEDGFQALLRCATLCNRAEFLPDQMEVPVLNRKVRGDASEEAILKFVELTTVLGTDYRERNPKLVEVPFSSATKYQISVHALEDETCLVVMKGAPEIILERCTKILYGDETLDMDPSYLEMCHNVCVTFAEMGERVLGFCDFELQPTYTRTFEFKTEPANFPQRGMRFLGLVAMIDPARPQVPAAIQRCKAAGIKVAMVTGDHPITAKAIAVKVGIITETEIYEFLNAEDVRKLTSSEGVTGALVVHGNVLRELLQSELDDILFTHTEIVFARTSPTQKLQIVESYQRLGEIVAVTGDGVNDAPALKKADIGVAMGITGTEVSQQAADIILLDDNFASIITGIEEGRKIFDNLKKSITYTLASNVPEILPFLAYTFMGIPLPMGVIAILCIDLLTDMMPAISLAYEKAESDIMLRPPRNPLRDKLVSRRLYFLAYGHLGMIEAMSTFFVYFTVMAEHGFFPWTLMGIRNQWEDEHNNKVLDSFKRKWTFTQRSYLEKACYSACLVSVVVAQWSNLIACKTRLNSISYQKMGNHVLNVSLVVETIFTCILCYIPGTYYLSFMPVHWRWWLYSLPYSLMLFGFDEFRKWHVRKYPKGWYQRETFY